MSEGWIKTHRKVMNSEIWKDIFKHRLWEICLLKATHTAHDQIVGNQVVTLKPGEFVTGRKVLTEEFNQSVGSKYSVSEKTIERWLVFFEKREMVTIKKTNKYTVVTITNWSKYQKGDQQMSNKCPTDDQQMSTNKNVKNVNKNINSPAESQDNTHSTSKVKKKEPPKKEIQDIVDYLNSVCGTNYKHTTKATAYHINARLAEGFTIDDFKQVVDKKAKQWLSNPEMSKYLRPQTLFGKNFEGYLNELNQANQQAPPIVMKETEDVF